MKSWLFCLICFLSAVGTSFLLLFFEQKFHIKQRLIERLHIGWFMLITPLSLFTAAGIAIFINSDLVKSPVFLGILLGFFCFIVEKTSLKGNGNHE